ncbi:MAG: hypothetical protein Q4A76_11235, partial [Porphyromonadaceae bacterium]|nr:hypothetical protein [Porphyromonadaceae bacterium]
STVSNMLISMVINSISMTKIPKKILFHNDTHYTSLCYSLYCLTKSYKKNLNHLCKAVEIYRYHIKQLTKNGII